VGMTSPISNSLSRIESVKRWRAKRVRSGGAAVSWRLFGEEREFPAVSGPALLIG
jgi:hypothetical protein